MQNPGVDLLFRFLQGRRTARPGMVSWYNPFQLVRTGLRILLSHRPPSHPIGPTSHVVEASYLDYRADCDSEFSFDFVADCGDGWNSTYAVAHGLGREQLELEAGTGQVLRLPGADLLILGGDLVYPHASSDGYRARLLQPYSAAFSRPPDPPPEVLALPGNHDWYDGLEAFRTLFCSGNSFGAWRTRQRQSYFAARLPYGWWILGFDTQLQDDIDEVQQLYFRAVLQKIKAEEGLILCYPDPRWLSSNDRVASPDRLRLDELVEELRTRPLVLELSGDTHNYQRLSDGHSHRIICGTGGAFLHPTHAARGRHKRQHCYPNPRVSRSLSFGNVLFLFRNPGFGLLIAPLYLVIAWLALPGAAQNLSISQTWGQAQGIVEVAGLLFRQIGSRPGGASASLLTLFLCLLFADRSNLWFRCCAGCVHAAFHLAAAPLLYVASVLACDSVVPASPAGPALALTLFLTGSWVYGSTVMGLYLLVSLELFGKHANESFAALRIEDWKGFLRIRIASTGTLAGFFVGIDRVPQRWKKRPVPGTSDWIPESGSITYRLIDSFRLPGCMDSGSRGSSAERGPGPERTLNLWER